MANNRIQYPVYGTFNVTTEGDCEGKSTRHLGTYTGYIDDIAFALADKCYYSLCFSLVKPEDLDMTPKKDSVNIHLDIDSGTWDKSPIELVDYYKNLFKERKVSIEKGNFSSSVNIYKNMTDEEKKEIQAKRVLAKLNKNNITEEEIKLLLDYYNKEK